MPTINRGRSKPREKTLNKGLYQNIYQDKRWKSIRKYKFMMNPVCEICEKNGITTQTEEVHHIVPFMTGCDKYDIEFLAFDFDNLQSLCIEHHKLLENNLKKLK